jgi:hypothetical protein
MLPPKRLFTSLRTEVGKVEVIGNCVYIYVHAKRKKNRNAILHTSDTMEGCDENM